MKNKLMIKQLMMHLVKKLLNFVCFGLNISLFQNKIIIINGIFLIYDELA